jgi:hypothetical protein
MFTGPCLRGTLALWLNTGHYLQDLKSSAEITEIIFRLQVFRSWHETHWKRFDFEDVKLLQICCGLFVKPRQDRTIRPALHRPHLYDIFQNTRGQHRPLRRNLQSKYRACLCDNVWDTSHTRSEQHSLSWNGNEMKQPRNEWMNACMHEWMHAWLV